MLEHGLMQTSIKVVQDLITGYVRKGWFIECNMCQNNAYVDKDMIAMCTKGCECPLVFYMSLFESLQFNCNVFRPWLKVFVIYKTAVGELIVSNNVAVSINN